MFGKERRYVEIPQSVQDKGAGAVRQWVSENGYRYDTFKRKAFFYDEDKNDDPDRKREERKEPQGTHRGTDGELQNPAPRGTPSREGSGSTLLTTDDTDRAYGGKKPDGNRPATVLTEQDRDDRYVAQGEFQYQPPGERTTDNGLRALQRQLYQIDGGKYYPGGGEDQGGDGVYGDNTAKAVREFAREHGIETDGKVITPEIRKLIIEKAREEPMAVGR